MTTPSDIPPGFEKFSRTSPFLDQVGQIWVLPEPSAPRFAIRIADNHLNNKGTAHGGIISTLADIACGYTLYWSAEPAPNLVTIHLATEFLGAAKHGDWLEATGTVVSRTRRIACARASLATERGAVAHATALFHIQAVEGLDHR